MLEQLQQNRSWESHILSRSWGLDKIRTSSHSSGSIFPLILADPTSHWPCISECAVHQNPGAGWSVVALMGSRRLHNITVRWIF